MILMPEVLRIALVSGVWRGALIWEWLEVRRLCGMGKYWLLPPSLRALASSAVLFRR